MQVRRWIRKITQKKDEVEIIEAVHARSEDFITRIGYPISYVILGMLVVGVLSSFVEDHMIDLFGHQRWEIIGIWYLRIFFGLSFFMFLMVILWAWGTVDFLVRLYKRTKFKYWVIGLVIVLWSTILITDAEVLIWQETSHNGYQSFLDCVVQESVLDEHRQKQTDLGKKLTEEYSPVECETRRHCTVLNGKGFNTYTFAGNLPPWEQGSVGVYPCSKWRWGKHKIVFISIREKVEEK